MTNSMLKFGFPLAIALVTASLAAVAQQSDQTPGIKIEPGKVQQTRALCGHLGSDDCDEDL